MDWLECIRYLRKVNKMNSKELDIVVGGLYPLVKKNFEWITRNKLEKLSKLLKRHNYFEGTRTDLEITMAYTYLDEFNFYCKLPQVKKNILDDFKELFEIYTWLRNTSDYQVSITIPREEVHKVIDKILDKIPKGKYVYIIKNIYGEFNPAIYNTNTGKISCAKVSLKDEPDEYERFLKRNKLNIEYRYASKEEAESLLENFYGLSKDNIPDDIIREVIIEE